MFVGGNFPVTDQAFKARKPASEIVFNNNGFTTVNIAQALVYHYCAATDTLKEIIYWGTKASDQIVDFEYINQTKV